MSVDPPPATDPADSASADRGESGNRRPGAATAEAAYADRLIKLQGKWWKKLLPVQAPYRARIRAHRLGRTVDVGCGHGRNLGYLAAGSVGVDHNPHLVAQARDLGLAAYTTDEFFSRPELARPGGYDGLLAAHLIEHLTPAEARSVMAQYVPLLAPGGRALFVTPQERGYASDPTHVAFTGFTELRALATDLGLTVTRQYSFPFPRRAGKAFVYNEFHLLATRPQD